MALIDAVLEASASQSNASRDGSARTRVIAGPGSGKSKVIEDRVEWLLESGIDPYCIIVLSFTRASVKDLRKRILARCGDGSGASNVRVSTLHSLALSLLKSEGQLSQYPTDPRVLSDWELEEIFDPEFGKAENVLLKSRQQEIRRFHEALWETGREDHPNYRPQGSTVSESESAKFNRFHHERTSVYACVLPGEIVSQCLALVNSGILDPRESMNVEHLIVDEYQDLNPTDLAFIDVLANEGVKIFVAGDDDQSIYSFRYASPLGIQKFAEKYPDANHHELQHCFRCAPSILETANSLITSTQSSDRVDKSPIAIQSFAEPELKGFVHRWRFDDADAEARAIAQSCRKLIANGLSPDDILILLRSKKSLSKPLIEMLESYGLPFTSLVSNKITDTNTGRALLAILRVACEGEEENDHDYVAHRVLLGLVPRVGVGTCNSICTKVVRNALNYRNLFYANMPSDVFTEREATAIERVAAICQNVSGWQRDDVLLDRMDELSRAIDGLLGTVEMPIWDMLMASIPEHINLGELSDYLGADGEEAQQRILVEVRNRLSEEEIPDEEIPPKINVLSMHGAKGLSAQVVFIPGLEENTIPSSKSQLYTGLIQEEARLLYVSITRARASCVMSFARNRMIHGTYSPVHPSRFNALLNGRFERRVGGLTDMETVEILNDAERLTG